MSPHGQQVEPDISIPITGLSPSWIPQFRNPGETFDGSNYHVHGSCGVNTMSCVLYLHATR